MSQAKIKFSYGPPSPTKIQTVQTLQLTKIQPEKNNSFIDPLVQEMNNPSIQSKVFSLRSSLKFSQKSNEIKNINQQALVKVNQLYGTQLQYKYLIKLPQASQTHNICCNPFQKCFPQERTYPIE